MNDAVSEHYPIRPNHFCDGQRGGNLNRRDAGLLQFGRDRSAAARASPSGRSQYHAVDPKRLCLFSHFTPHAPGVGKRIGQARR